MSGLPLRATFAVAHTITLEDRSAFVIIGRIGSGTLHAGMTVHGFPKMPPVASIEFTTDPPPDNVALVFKTRGDDFGNLAGCVLTLEP